MSRNHIELPEDYVTGVTSHKGCVSRNFKTMLDVGIPSVTSHKGCVSRNFSHQLSFLKHFQSHPTRDV